MTGLASMSTKAMPPVAPDDCPPFAIVPRDHASNLQRHTSSSLGLLRASLRRACPPTVWRVVERATQPVHLTFGLRPPGAPAATWRASHQRAAAWPAAAGRGDRGGRGVPGPPPSR